MCVPWLLPFIHGDLPYGEGCGFVLRVYVWGVSGGRVGKGFAIGERSAGKDACEGMQERMRACGDACEGRGVIGRAWCSRTHVYPACV